MAGEEEVSRVWDMLQTLLYLDKEVLSYGSSLKNQGDCTLKQKRNNGRAFNKTANAAF